MNDLRAWASKRREPTKPGSVARGVAALALAIALVASDWPAAHAADLADADLLLLTGKYEEAAEQYQALAGQSPLAAALGLARAKASVGDYEQAQKILQEAIAAAKQKSPELAAAHAELASLAFDRGDHAAAQKQAAEARAIDDDSLLARWVEAELLRTTGKLDEANAAYRWFVEHYNRHDVEDPGSLILVGKAAAHYARWNRSADQFNFLVNDLLPDALKAQPKFWPAHYEAGLLFLEKFNQAEASRELKQAVAINPNAAPVHAALAHLALQRFDMDQARESIERALAINPNLLSARLAKSDLTMANFAAAEAAQQLEEARPLNPIDEELLGRLAATYAIIDGFQPAGPPADSRLGRIIAEVEARNPHAGLFYFTLATSLEERRQFAAATEYFNRALERMPRLVGPHAGLGMMSMRLGEEARARQLLDEAFKIDPYNVRVSNTLKVLDVLEGYQTLETEHFVIKYDPEKDKILARYVGDHLERVYPQLCQLLGYEPAEKSLFEIFNQAKNTGGHGWFSARTIGLPYIGTVGACTGKMVAMASPTEGKRRFNWARVLKHEFVHVINLQQTNFNIPHWFTEALAVWNEGFPRPQEWNALLVQRVPSGKTFNLDTINLGFIRPETSENWQMAYCQAELYAEYLLKRFGDDAFAKLLAAYADNLDTRGALKRCFGVEQQDFEDGYRAYLQEIVAGLSAQGAEPAQKLSELEHALQEDPRNPDKVARLALAKFERREYPEARKLVKQAFEIDKKHQLASVVQARLQLLIGDDADALSTLDNALDREQPDPQLVALLATAKTKSRDFDAAADLYQLMIKRQPDEVRWVRGLARVYLLSGQNGPLAQTLEKLAAIDADDVAVRKKLAEMALADEDYRRAAEWSARALDVEVMDPTIHATLAKSYAKIGEPRKAADEYAVAIELAPDDPELRMGLAEASLAAGDLPAARRAADELLKLAPDYPGGKELSERIKP